MGAAGKWGEGGGGEGGGDQGGGEWEDVGCRRRRRRRRTPCSGCGARTEHRASLSVTRNRAPMRSEAAGT
eukprot:3552633-Rhodomonas_salina.1